MYNDQKIIGSHLVALQNWLAPQHDSVNAFKVKVTCKKWQNIFPNESVKILRDMETNEMAWEDPNNLIPNVVKAEIERCLQQKGEEMSNCMFDSISYWYFHVAAHPFVKQILLPVSDNVDVRRESEGKTPLMTAKAVAKLIERGATVEATDQNGRRALHYAAMYGGESSCEILLFHGAKVDAQDETETTALMSAAYHGHAKIVKMLLKFDADAKISDKYGKTAIDFAKRFNRQNCADVLGEHIAKLNSKFLSLNIITKI